MAIVCHWKEGRRCRARSVLLGGSREPRDADLGGGESAGCGAELCARQDGTYLLRWATIT